MAKLNIKTSLRVMVQAQQIVLEHLASAVRNADRAALDNRNSDTVFDNCQDTLLGDPFRTENQPHPEEYDEIVRVIGDLWHYLRYQMTDEDNEERSSS